MHLLFHILPHTLLGGSNKYVMLDKWTETLNQILDDVVKQWVFC